MKPKNTAHALLQVFEAAFNNEFWSSESAITSDKEGKNMELSETKDILIRLMKLSKILDVRIALYLRLQANRFYCTF